jgi:hypothetical protein
MATGAESKSVVPFVLDSRAAEPADVVTIRIAGTQRGFTVEDAEKPFRKAMRLYLVRSDISATVRSRFDPRLHFIGRIVPDRRMRGLLSFVVPPLETAAYDIVFWCPECAGGRGNRIFGMWPELRIRMRDPSAACPVTRGVHGNGFLSVTLPANGVLAMIREPDGTFFNKLGWLPKKGFGGELEVRGDRLDAPGRLRVLQVSWGHVFVNGVRGRGSWRSAVTFPSEGCWRLTGRVADISLSYAVEVVAAP